jgi:hypothetical protein
VKLTVTDDYGLSSSAVQQVVVPAPQPAVAPVTCTASSRSRTVYYQADADAARSTQPRDALQLTLRCTQSVRATVTGSITARRPVHAARRHHRKLTAHTFRLAPTNTALSAGQTAAVVVKLPPYAIKPLREGLNETARFTITATARNSSSTLQLTITNLNARKAPTHRK